jgi:hypothetical protein
MRKLIAICITVLVILSISEFSYAQTDPLETSKTISVSVSVSGDQFGFQIWPTEYSQVIGPLAPGEAGFGDVHIYATSNRGNPWTMEASSVGLAGGTTGAILPVWFATFDGIPVGDPAQHPVGTFADPAIELTGAAQQIYAAAAAEYTVLGLQIAGLVVIKTDLATQQDTYDGVMLMTMTE